MVSLKCNYLVVGAGAASMAFIDTLITQMPSVKIVLIDKNPVPGGHWVHSYGFVHLHQPSIVYGISSRQLEGSWKTLLFRKLTLPWKHRASKKEILTYFRDFIQDKISSGHIQYFPNCFYDFKQQRTDPKSHHFSSLDGTQIHYVTVVDKLVNGVLGECIIPSQNPAKFPVDEGVTMMTPNQIYDNVDEIRKTNKLSKKFVVLGAGKTAMDTVVFLQRSGKVDPENIIWVISNDVWMMARGGANPFTRSIMLLKYDGDEKKAMETLEEKGMFVRLDKNFTPTKFKYPIIGEDELELMRKVKNVIRKGRVNSIQLNKDTQTITVQFDRSEEAELFSPVQDYTFVHCTSAGPFNGVTPKACFVSSGQLDLFMLFAPPVSFSMSCLAYLEAVRKKGTIDVALLKKLYEAINLDDKNNSENVTIDQMLGSIVQPFQLSQKQYYGALINIAVLLAIADPDPMVSYEWMKRNRLSFFSIPGFKGHAYEQMKKLASKGESLGLSNEMTKFVGILRDKLEPLEGK